MEGKRLYSCECPFKGIRPHMLCQYCDNSAERHYNWEPTEPYGPFLSCICNSEKCMALMLESQMEDRC